jgi:hypothetical protein
MPATLAHPQQQHYLAVRAELAAQSYQHTSFTIELLAGLGKRVVQAVGPTLQRWAAAHRQRVEDRLFWELALTDPRVMDDLRAMRDHADQA